MNWNAMSLPPLQVAGDASRCETRKILWPSIHYGSGLINVDPCWRDGASDGSWRWAIRLARLESRLSLTPGAHLPTTARILKCYEGKQPWAASVSIWPTYSCSCPGKEDSAFKATEPQRSKEELLSWLIVLKHSQNTESISVPLTFFPPQRKKFMNKD